MDEQAFKDFEFEMWESKSSVYADFFHQLTPQTLEPIFRWLGPAKDRRLLDLACGPGYVAEHAHAQGFQTLALDFSPQMVEVARARLPELAIEVGDAENLTVEDSCFDAVVMNFGLLHLANPASCLSHCNRILRERGALACTVWLPPNESAGLEILFEAIAECADTSVIPEGPDFFRFADQNYASKTLKDVGFTSISFEKINTKWRLDDKNDFYTAFVKGGARVGGLIDAQPPARALKLKESILERIEEYRSGSEYVVPQPSLLIRANK